MSAQADFRSALDAYETQDYAKAFEEFKRLSELGDAPSQRNVAVMYFNGEHVEQNIVDAYAWAKLSIELPNEENEAIYQVIAKKLPGSMMQQAEQRFISLQQQFGQKALKQRLMPVAEARTADCSVEASGNAVAIETVPPRYPMQAAKEGTEGYACFNFYLSKSGQPKRIAVYDADAYSADDKETKRTKFTFVRESQNAIKKWKFMPAADESLRENRRSYCLDFSLQGFSRKEVRDIQKNEKLANEDDQNAEVLLKLSTQYKDIASHLKMNGNEKYVDYEQGAQALKLRSAIYGNSEAQYSVASDLLTGNQCTKDEQKGVVWLTFAAQQGHAKSQFLLANHLMNGEGVKKQPEKAMHWYKLAAENGHEPARIAYLKLAIEDEEINVAALEPYLPETIEQSDMRELEVAAAFAARKGNFVDAVKWQTTAVEIANELEFSTEQRLQKLQHYQQMLQNSSQASN